MILVFLGTVALLGLVCAWGLHLTKPRAFSHDMRRADAAESVAHDHDPSEPTRRAFDANTWVHV